MNAPPRYQLLGPLRAWRDGREVDLGPAKQRAVLAVLLLEPNRPVSTAQIVDAVWRDDPPVNGANVVQKYVAGLRRALEPERSPRDPEQLLATTDAGYLLRVPPGDTDADAFHARARAGRAALAADRPAEAAAELRAALALWRGEPLAGLAGPLFDAARERLGESRAEACEGWAAAELALGHHGRLIPDLLRLVAEYPLREELRGHLMLALHRAGRQAEALAAYRDARQYLADEYGVEPGRRLQDLHRRILQSDPALLPPPRLAEPPATAPVAAPAADEATQAPASAPPPGLAVDAPPLSEVAPTEPPPVAGWVPPPGWFADQPVSGVPIPVAETPGSRWRWVGALAAGLIALASFGAATWAVIAFFAIRRGSRLQGAFAAGYLALFSVFLAVALSGDPEQFHPDDVLGMAAWLVAWLGGTAHGLALGLTPPRQLAAPRSPALPTEPPERRVRRAQARELALSRPDIAGELRIGRPDLPRTFDDGGLVDVNGAPERVLAGLPGISPETAWRIVADREERGPYGSVADLASRGLVSRPLLAVLGDLLIAIPPA